MNRILAIDFARGASQAVSLQGEPAAYRERLCELGFSELRLAGLDRFDASALDGSPLEGFTVPVDPDVELLLGHYRALELTVLDQSPTVRRIYLDDGCLELTAAAFSEDEVRVRVGIFERSFAAPWVGGVTLTWGEYLAAWRNVARLIVEASEHG
ncbi:MAG: hypothetical protein HOV80_29930 [Polyangiaceae bacterium]|nr:hypothetical protein [Polyangiaceae bacterium]